MAVMLILLRVLLSYLLGTVPTAYLFARAMKGVDIREYGSGNVGATNAVRVLGKTPGLLVLIIDVIKGIIAVTFISRMFFFDNLISFEVTRSLCGIAVVSGHIFNVFLGGKGGKGVATSAGVLLAIAPQAMLLGGLLFVVIVAVTRYVSLGSITAGLVIPFFMLYAKIHFSYTIMSAFLCILIVAKHRPNICRLLTGREKKVFEKR
ncbi:MAG: glycerol-3-phosphate 1-O-acyltransferase PlsY [Candidatus Omnitrophica bacterium]|nr:glycerol-3-phosphate 1-O-acyltransferase PlsY [Candidatus Omnitrophota bacterium]MBU4478146.1 glycerol-3-phosphate 1-O-acyltransferase PlsY [Candidatus Omnitrophota bacterium]MCG2704057.1 glycerol-3-phosphate 1-O-acyltransferase PlsY [Candidatus Omnitrophota bacterium]